MEDLSEKEQLEQMRAWWSDYGNYVVGGVVLGALILFGYNYIENSRIQAQLEASMLYDTLTEQIVAADVEAAEASVAQLASEHTDTPYVAQARLALARLYMDQNRDQDAADVLAEIRNGAGPEEFRKVATLRLAKILLYQGKPEEVLPLLEGEVDGAFAARYADVLGDAYVMLERYVDARDAYQRALAEASGASTVNQTFVQLKLLDLPVEAFAAAGDGGDVADDADDAIPETDAPDDADDDVVVEEEADTGEEAE